MTDVCDFVRDKSSAGGRVVSDLTVRSFKCRKVRHEKESAGKDASAHRAFLAGDEREVEL